MKYSGIVIIYNPNSTGDSPAMAKEFYEELREKLPNTPVTLNETERAGHAEELAYEAATRQPDVLIVSVSGDGGYNEVVNGAMKAVNEAGAKPICAILPGGNANDHHTSVSKRPLIEAVLAEGIERFDLLAVEFENTKRYAHSYAGLGLTPLVAKELNEHTLNRFREMWLALKTYWSYRPFAIIHDGQKKTFDSILMVVIDRMAKHLTLDEDNRPDDGTFDLFHWPHGNKRKLFGTLFRALLGKKIPYKEITSYAFTTVKPMPMQLDGELIDLPANADITVRIAPDKLRTLI